MKQVQQDIKLQVSTLIDKLSKSWWSPRRPETYQAYLDGRNIGVGIIAYKDIAAFNVAWALVPNPKLINDYKNGIDYYFEFTRITKFPVLNADLAWWLTSQTHAEFVKWYATHRDFVPPEAYRLLDYVTKLVYEL